MSTAETNENFLDYIHPSTDTAASPPSAHGVQFALKCQRLCDLVQDWVGARYINPEELPEVRELASEIRIDPLDLLVHFQSNPNG